jgi:hypothetical protein
VKALIPALKSAALFVEMLIYEKPSNFDRLSTNILMNSFAGPSYFEYGISTLETVIFSCWSLGKIPLMHVRISDWFPDRPIFKKPMALKLSIPTHL